MKYRFSLLSRRHFITGFVGGGICTAALFFAYPVIRFLFHKTMLPLPKMVSIPVEEIEKIPINNARYFNYGWMPAILVRVSQEEYTAFNAVCTHLDCNVEYKPDKKVFFCNCHNGTFDLNGKNISGPPPRPLKRLNVFIDGDKMFITESEKSA